MMRSSNRGSSFEDIRVAVTVIPLTFPLLASKELLGEEALTTMFQGGRKRKKRGNRMSQPPIKSLFLEAPPSDLVTSPWQLLAAKETGTCGF